MPDGHTSSEWYSRTEALLGPEGVEKLRGARVLIAGIGGVGGYAAETLVRSGIGELTIVDADTVAHSNLNRQLIALRSTLGLSKVEAAARRYLDINPECRVSPCQQFLTPENIAGLQVSDYDFVADCIDTVAPKVALLRSCLQAKVPVISSMGAGGRTDPTRVIYSTLWETREDGLARAVRAAFKKIGTRPRLPVVCSTEAPKRPALLMVEEQGKRSSFGTLATIPAIFGLYIANYIILKIANS